MTVRLKFFRVCYLPDTKVWSVYDIYKDRLDEYENEIDMIIGILSGLGKLGQIEDVNHLKDIVDHMVKNVEEQSK